MRSIPFYKYILIFIGVWVVALGAAGQKVLIMENSRNLRNIKYFQGDEIRLILKKDEMKVADLIFDMTDSSLVTYDFGEIRFSDIKAVVRENYWIDLISGFSMLAGALYFGIDSFNRLINAEWPMVDEQTLAISAGIVGFGFILLPFRFNKYPVGEKWKLRVIDLQAY
jgi:hypothetical protein